MQQLVLVQIVDPCRMAELPEISGGADHALGESFRDGLARLRAIGHETPCAIMCAEAVWWRCHRRIIADYLLAAGEDVRHIMAHDRIEPAKMTDGARPGADGLTYPALI